MVGAIGNLNFIVSIDKWTHFASFVLAREGWPLTAILLMFSDLI
jgi:hypothetical protein